MVWTYRRCAHYYSSRTHYYFVSVLLMRWMLESNRQNWIGPRERSLARSHWKTVSNGGSPPPVLACATTTTHIRCCLFRSHLSFSSMFCVLSPLLVLFFTLCAFCLQPVSWFSSCNFIGPSMCWCVLLFLSSWSAVVAAVAAAAVKWQAKHNRQMTTTKTIIIIIKIRKRSSVENEEWRCDAN